MSGIDLSQVADKATERATSAPAPKSSGLEYVELVGPCEVVGGRGDAFVVAHPSTGVEYIEYRPRGGGRVKRVPLIAAPALGLKAHKPRAPRAAGDKKAEKEG
jgi:hypothetical protein